VLNCLTYLKFPSASLTSDVLRRSRRRVLQDSTVILVTWFWPQGARHVLPLKVAVVILRNVSTAST
jgi:hypothetical protein